MSDSFRDYDASMANSVVEQATAAPGERRVLDAWPSQRCRIDQALAELYNLNVPESALEPIREWMRSHA